MALHEPVTPSIGETIDDEGPSKAKQFFTDPKNISTMLVLASMLAQPRRGGRSPLAHGLRGGVGALAFRGGLDQQIHLQTQKDAEQQSIAQSRIDASTAQAGQLAATERRTDVTAETAAAGQEAATGRLETEIDAGRFEHPPQAGGTFTERAMLVALKNHGDAMIQWEAFGRQGPAPDFGASMLQAMQSAALIGAGPPGQIGFEPTATLSEPESGDEVIPEPPGPGVETPQIPKPTERNTQPSILKTPDFSRDVRGERVAQANFLKIKNPTLFTKETSDDDIFDTVSRIDQQARGQLETMTADEARDFLKKFRNILPSDTIKALKQVVSKGGPTFSSLPKTRN